MRNTLLTVLVGALTLSSVQARAQDAETSAALSSVRNLVQWQTLASGQRE